MGRPRIIAEDSVGAARGLARTTFLAFLFMYLARRSPHDADKLGEAWRYRALAFELGGLGPGMGGRLILSLPPFLDASTLVCAVWAAWLVGREPTAKVVSVSSSKALGRRHVEACRAIMEEPWYEELFPAAKLARASLDEVRTASGGGCFSTSFVGGRTAVIPDVLILDEPLSIAEARSATVREQRDSWVADNVGAFANGRARPSIVLVSPRVHADDLAGRLMQSPLWRRLDLPAVAIETRHVEIGGGRVHTWRAGEPLDPDSHSRDNLARIRNAVGPAAFAARYLQRPLAVAPDRTAGGWPRYEAAELREGRRPTVSSWVFNADATSGNVTATRVVLAGEDVHPHIGSLQITAAPAEVTVSPTLFIGDGLHLAQAPAGGRVWLVKVVQETLAPAALPDYVQAAAATGVADHHAVKTSASGRQLMKDTVETRVFAGHAHGLIDLSEGAARSLLDQAIACGQIILPFAAAWRVSIEEQLAVLDYDSLALSPELMALAQALYHLQRNLVAASLSMVIGDLSDVQEDNDDDQDVSARGF